MKVTLMSFPGRGIRVSGLRRIRNCNSYIRARSNFVTYFYDPLEAFYGKSAEADDATVDSSGKI